MQIFKQGYGPARERPAIRGTGRHGGNDRRLTSRSRRYLYFADGSEELDIIIHRKLERVRPQA